MPRLVADIHSGALAPRSALGYARIPGQIEWELLPVATTQLTPIATSGMHALTYKNRARETGPALFATPVSFVRKRVVRSLAANQNAPWVKWRGRIFESEQSDSIFASPAIESLVIDITSERFTTLEHPPQSQIHKKLEP